MKNITMLSESVVSPYLITLSVLFVIRFFYVVYLTIKNKRLPCERTFSKPAKTMIIIGSGGHTAEMLKLIQKIDYDRYCPRIYAMASNDITSELKIISHELALGRNKGEYSVMKVPRCRSVGQPYISSVFTTLYSTVMSVPKMLNARPELILCNGPGTCVPLCLIAFLMRVLFLSDNKIVFIESICRVTTLSLTGHILLLFADVMYVQWPELKNRYPRTTYVGNLI